MIISLLITSLLLFLITFFLLKVFIKNAEKFNLIDIPNTRSAHKTPIARGAGIVFGFVFLIVSFLLNNFSVESATYNYVLISLVIVFLTGLYDDLQDISSKAKFFFIILATIFAFIDGISINSLGNYFGYELHLGYLALPFTIFAVVGYKCLKSNRWS